MNVRNWSRARRATTDTGTIGAGLRDYMLAVLLAAAAVIIGLTALADELYSAYVRVFGP